MKYVVSAYVVRWNLVLGVIFVAIISFMPEGLVPGSIRVWGVVRRRFFSPPPLAGQGSEEAARPHVLGSPPGRLPNTPPQAQKGKGPPMPVLGPPP
jgi:branched-chain amino acid transport system permease protein